MDRAPLRMEDVAAMIRGRGMTRSFPLALLVLLGLPGPARAQPVTPLHPRVAGVAVSCTTSRGEPVAFVPNTSLADVGLWFAGWPGVPAHVEYNPQLLARLPAPAQLFWFGHTCLHASPTPGAGEEDADCGGLQLLKRRGLVSRAQVVEIQQWSREPPGVPWGHHPGPARAQRLLACYDRSPAPPKKERRGHEYAPPWPAPTP